MAKQIDSLSGIKELVARFDTHRESYLSGRYLEAQLRVEFIDPMWSALGWDVHNVQGYAEAYKDVIHEDAIKVSADSFTKAPDYCFRIGGVRKFFLEAKKPSVDIKGDPAPAFQLRRYAWSAKLPLSVLTDFEELAIYDTRIRPAEGDKASHARTMLIHYTDYVERWDEIASVFSRDAVLKGSFDKYAESSKAKRGTTPVNEAFLAEIESWRVELARNIALRNSLDTRELNFVVQATIDRIIFLRICEDRGIEPYGDLLGLTNGTRVYRRLFEKFELADTRYNSGLFHFSTEQGQNDVPDFISQRIDIDDKPLRDIIRSLYYPTSPYEFSVLPADILGQVYEQFLGKVIRLTSEHRAVVEEKLAVKRAGGVYYTPTYIVEYIVRESIGRLLESKTPREISGIGRRAKVLRIVDPACGSGSFLLGAYQCLLDWHRDWYFANGLRRFSIGKAPTLYQAAGGGWRLTTAERKRILLTHIFGVDIDQQAVEVTKLSLLLKVLEGESSQTLQTQFRLFRERALPDLSNNIKCGNSLVGPDFFEDRQLSIVGDDASHINVFDWSVEFVAAVRDGGFGAVIGNPPWGATFGDEELAYLRKTYRRVIDRTVDSYIYFIDKAVRLASHGAPVGFIVPSTLLNQSDATAVRGVLLERGLSALVSLGKDVFTRKVLNTSTIFVSESRGDQSNIAVSDVSTLPLDERKDALKAVPSQSWLNWKKLVKDDPHSTFVAGQASGVRLVRRLRRSHSPLKDFVDGEIQRGVSPDQVAAHVLPLGQATGIERDVLRKSISGSQIKRYHDWVVDQNIIYTTRDTDIRRYPKALAHLSEFRALGTCREVAEKKHPWWALHRPRSASIFERPKIIGLTTARTFELAWDGNANLYVTDAMYVFSPVAECDPMAIMAILQSRLFLYLYQAANQGESRIIPQIKASKIGELPFPDIGTDESSATELRSLAQALFSLNRTSPSTPHGQTARVRQVAVIETKIETIVRKLYGISAHEMSLLA